MCYRLRCADDDDFIIDKLQEEFSELVDKEEDQLGTVLGSQEWKANMAAKASFAKAKEMEPAPGGKGQFKSLYIP